MTFSVRSAALLALVVPVLALSACGSDDDGDGGGSPSATTAASTPATTPAGTGGAAATPAGDPLDKAALAEQANAICKATNDEGDALTSPPDNADNDHLADFYAKLADLANQQQTGLEALTPDAATKDDWAAFLALTKEATTLVQGVAPAIRVDGGGKSDAIAKRIDAISPKINAAADALGARICGSDSGES